MFNPNLSIGKRIINIDESTLDQTAYIRRGWGTTGKQLYSKTIFRLYKFNIIAAVSIDKPVCIITL